MVNRSYLLEVAVLCFFFSFVKGKDTVHCSFEKDSCEWKEVKTKNCWLISKPNERLLEMTGFMYFNKTCSSSEIITKPLSAFFTKSEEELHFWYYMHGRGDGELFVIDHDAFGPIFGNKPRVRFHCRGDRGHQWYHAHMKIPGGTMFMGIIAKTRGDFLIAVDNITADSHGTKVPSKQVCRPLTTTSRKPITTIKTSTISPTKRQFKTNKPTSTYKQARTSENLIINKETTMKSKSQSLITKSVIIPSDSTVRVATKSNEATTPPSDDLHTNMATTTEKPEGGSTMGNESVSDQDYHASAITAKKEQSRKISIITGACIGGILLAIGVILAGYLTYRRMRLRSMYSFKRRTLNEENVDNENIRAF